MSWQPLSCSSAIKYRYLYIFWPEDTNKPPVMSASPQFIVYYAFYFILPARSNNLNKKSFVVRCF